MTTELLTISLAGNFIAIIAVFYFMKTKSNNAAVIAKTLLMLSFIMLTVYIIFAWTALQRPPFKTMFESLILFSWCIGFVGLFTLFNKQHHILWLLVAIASVFTLYYALNNRDLEKVFLPPALQSVWFIPHVIVYFIGYSALGIGTLSALSPTFGTGQAGNWLQRVIPGLKVLNEPAVNDKMLMSGKFIGIGFVFLTCGLILGAVWAEEAWGTYWGWDPKENWALVTFLTYGSYMHLSDAKKCSVVGNTVLWAGLFTILFTYLGMHLLPTSDSSLHVYQ